MRHLHGRIDLQVIEARMSGLVSFSSDIGMQTSVNDGHLAVDAGAIA
jgi:hypothetical protein